MNSASEDGNHGIEESETSDNEYFSGFTKLQLSEASRIRQTSSQLCICMSSTLTGLVQLKNLPKNINKNKRRENEINTIFNSSCLFTKNALIQSK